MAERNASVVSASQHKTSVGALPPNTAHGSAMLLPAWGPRAGCFGAGVMSSVQGELFRATV